MKTILFIIMIWLMLQAYKRRRAGFPSGTGRSSSFSLPEPAEADAPLPGPWSRPAPCETGRGEETVPLTLKETAPVTVKEKSAAYPAAAAKTNVCPAHSPQRKHRCGDRPGSLLNRQSLVTGIIMSEILGPPGGYKRKKEPLKMYKN